MFWISYLTMHDALKKLNQKWTLRNNAVEKKKRNKCLFSSQKSPTNTRCFEFHLKYFLHASYTISKEIQKICSRVLITWNEKSSIRKWF